VWAKQTDGIILAREKFGFFISTSVRRDVFRKYIIYRGLVISMLATGTQVCGFKPGRSCRIFRAEDPSACLSSEGK
jgi:hypothetical protein